MRQIIIDTETTGLNPRAGDRILEVGCVELLNRRLTGNNLHFYINPERDSDPAALAVHGLTTEFLSDKPKFAEIVDALRDFVRDAELIIHNAPFDIGFFNAEFERLNLPPITEDCAGVIDTLVQAKQMFPGKRNSLDALCDRFGINNSHRTLHGALLDSELLAEVYLAMTRGQESLVIDMLDEGGHAQHNGNTLRVTFSGLDLPVLAATADELAEHDAQLDALDKTVKGACIWRSAAAAGDPAASSDA